MEEFFRGVCVGKFQSMLLHFSTYWGKLPDNIFCLLLFLHVPEGSRYEESQHTNQTARPVLSSTCSSPPPPQDRVCDFSKMELVKKKGGLKREAHVKARKN